MTHAQVNFSVNQCREIGILLLDLGVDKLGKSSISHGKGEGHLVHAVLNCVSNVCGSPPTLWVRGQWQLAKVAF